MNRLAAYTANPSLQHYGSLKQILRYLNDMKSLGISYLAPKDWNNTENLFSGFANAVFMNADNLKSIYGYIFLVAGEAVTWRSKKHNLIILSSMKAEYIALSKAVREACWLRNLYGELGFIQNSPSVIKGDNNGSIIMAQNTQFHHQSKHIAIHHH